MESIGRIHFGPFGAVRSQDVYPNQPFSLSSMDMDTWIQSEEMREIYVMTKYYSINMASTHSRIQKNKGKR